MTKNLFTTKCAAGIYTLLLGIGLSIAPTVGKMLTRHTDNEIVKSDINDGVLIFVAIATAIGGGAVSISGRHDVGDTYTPKGFPGKDPPVNSGE